MNTDTLTVLADRIKDETTKLAAAVRASLTHARQIGTYLLEARQELPAIKSFQAWVEQTCPFSYSTAWNYMTVTQNWDKFSDDDRADLTLREMLRAVSEMRRDGRDTKTTAKPRAVDPASDIPAPSKTTPPVAAPSTTTSESGTPAPSTTTNPVTIPMSAVRPKGIDETTVRAAAERHGVTGDVLAFLAELGVSVAAGRGRAVG